MKDLLSTIRQMNKEPLQLHALKLLKQAKQETSETELYLTQAALQIRENPQICETLRNDLNEKTFSKLMEIVESLRLMNPKLQMTRLLDSQLTDEESREEILNCKTAEELIYLTADNIISNQMSIEAAELAELDATMSGYNDRSEKN